jgi:hypothetical protein
MKNHLSDSQKYNSLRAVRKIPSHVLDQMADKMEYPNPEEYNWEKNTQFLEISDFLENPNRISFVWDNILSGVYWNCSFLQMNEIRFCRSLSSITKSLGDRKSKRV